MNSLLLSFPVRFCCIAAVVAFIQLALSTSSSLGQQINVQTPRNSVSDSFFSRNGVNFGFSIPGGRGSGSRVVGLGPQGQLTPNLNFNQNGFGGAIPPFGGFDPNSSARFGFGNFNRNGGGFSLGFDFARGSNRSSVSTVPSVTVPNGFGGSFSNGASRPFVTGVVPVVSSGGVIQPKYSVLPQRPRNAVTDALQSGQLNLNNIQRAPTRRYDGPVNYSNGSSTAQTSDIGVAAIRAERARQEESKLAEAENLIQLATDFETRKDFRMARVSLRDAIKLINDESQKVELQARLKSLRGK